MENRFLAVAGLLLALLAARIFAPFLGALLAAASVALVLSPIRKTWVGRAPRHPAAAAAALTALVCLSGAVPFFFGGWAVLREAEEAYPAARYRLGMLSEDGGAGWKPPQRLAGAVAAGRDLAAALNLKPRQAVLENLDQLGAWAGGAARALVRNAAAVFLNLGVFAAALFLFLRDGEEIVRRASGLIPLPEADKERLLLRVRGVLLAVANGMFAVALVQGALAWAGFVLFRVPFAFLLGAACVLLSPIPFVGSALVWVPVVIYTALSGAAAKAAALALWFVLVVGLSDNVVRPILLGAQTKLPIPLVFVAVIGALKAFGLAGLFIGPLAIALAFGFYDIIRERRGA
jgi:predicted PurR-regulated permease PerM